MKYFVILFLFLLLQLICGNRFDSRANVSDVNSEKHVIQKRFTFLKNLFGFGASDDSTGPTVIIDRRFRGPPKRRRRLRKCCIRRRRFRRPVYPPIIGRRNFDLAFNYATHRPKYIGIIPAFKQPPDDTYYYSFPNGLLDGNRNVDMFEPAPGDLLYPPMASTITPKSKFNLHPKTKGPKLFPFYEHEAINLLQIPKVSSNEDNLYRRDDEHETNKKPVPERHNDILPPKNNNHTITIVTPPPVDTNILTLSKLINDRRKKTIYNNHQQQPQQQQNSEENLLKLNLINNLKSSRDNIVSIPLTETSNPSRGAHQSNYHHDPTTKLSKNSLHHHDAVVVPNNNKNLKLMITSHDRSQYGGSGTGDPDRNNNKYKKARDNDDHKYYDTMYHLQNKTILGYEDDRTRLHYTNDRKIGVRDDHSKTDQVNDFKIYNIEPNYNWVNVDTKTAFGGTTLSPYKYSSIIPASENPIKANSILTEETKIC